MKKRRAPRVLVETVARNGRDLRQDLDDDVRVAALSSFTSIEHSTDCDLPSSPRLRRKSSSRPPKKPSVKVPQARITTETATVGTATSRPPPPPKSSPENTVDTRPKVFGTDAELADARAMFADHPGKPSETARRGERKPSATMGAATAEGKQTARGKSLDKISELRREIGALREQLAMMHAAMARDAGEHDTAVDNLELTRKQATSFRDQLSHKETELHGIAVMLTEREQELTRQQDEAEVLRAALAREVENDEIRSRRIAELERSLKVAETERDGLRSTLNQRERELTVAHDQRKRAARKLEELMGLLHYVDILEGRIADARIAALEVAESDASSVVEDNEATPRG